jgi:hypothetical protein
MVPPVVDWAIVLFLFSSLTVLLKARVKLRSESREGYLYLSSGMVILTLVALSRLLSGFALLESVPFLSDPLFDTVLAWIAIIIGTVLMVSGLSNWLPISRAARSRQQANVARLEFVKTTEQLVQVETRPDAILEEALLRMARHFDLSSGAVYRYSNKQNQLVLTAAFPKEQNQILRNLDLQLDPDGWSRFNGGVRAEAAGIVNGFGRTSKQPTVVLPIVVSARPAGFFFLWTADANFLQEDSRSNLRIAVDIIARKFRSDQVHIRNQFLAQREEWRNRLMSVVDYSRTIRETLPLLVSEIRIQMAAEIFCLLVVDKHTGKMKRYTLGKNSTLLVETGLPTPAPDSAIGNAMTQDRPELFRADRIVDSVSQFGSSQFGHMRSVAVIPIKNIPGCAAAASVASKELNAYGRRKLELGEAIGDALARMIRLEIERSHAAVRERRIARLGSFISSSRDSEMEKACNEAASIIRDETRADVVRICSLSPGGESLALRGLAGSESTVSNRTWPITEIHREAISTGETLQRETVSASSAPSYTLLVPVRGHNRVAGLIEVTRSKSAADYPYSRADLQFTSLIANSLAFVLSSGRSLSTRSAVDSDLPLRSRVKSSLSGIMGSLEMMRSRRTSEPAEIDRYLAIMDRSAHRLSQYIENETQVGR